MREKEIIVYSPFSLCVVLFFCFLWLQLIKGRKSIAPMKPNWPTRFKFLMFFLIVFITSIKYIRIFFRWPSKWWENRYYSLNSFSTGTHFYYEFWGVIRWFHWHQERSMEVKKISSSSLYCCRSHSCFRRCIKSPNDKQNVKKRPSTSGFRIMGIYLSNRWTLVWFI